MSQKNSLYLTPNLFGLPYQFTDKVDPRVSDISEVLGKEYAENMVLEAPVCTFIPGAPSYLTNMSSSKKIDTSLALLSQSQDFVEALNLKENQSKKVDDMRLYDFKSAYNEYMEYVNVLCRAGATFLELNQELTINGKSTPLKSFDWRDFKWSTKGKTGSVATRLVDALVSKFKMDSAEKDEDTLDNIFTNYNFVQFYVDADISANESMGNSTSESQLRSLLDTGSSTMKELAFMANSGLGSDITGFLNDSAESLRAGVSEILGGGTSASSTLGRIINLGAGETLKGNNIIIPDVYQNSSYTKNYSITVHLKSPYGSKVAYYLNIFVPLMHLIALCMPKQSTSNSYASPFIIKAYVDGIFSCNMGIVEGLSVSRSAEAWSVDGLPTEIDVSLDLKDLYSNMSMTPSTSPVLFTHNSSLVEYLAVNCGLDLTKPNIQSKIDFTIGSLISSITDVPTNIKSSITETIDRFLTSALQLYNK